MKFIDVEHETIHKVGNYSETFVVSAKCTPTEEPGVHDINIVVKCKKRNRRRKHSGQIEIKDPVRAIDDVKEYMSCGGIVTDMLDEISEALLEDFPEIYPEIDFDE